MRVRFKLTLLFLGLIFIGRSQQTPVGSKNTSLTSQEQPVQVNDRALESCSNHNCPLNSVCVLERCYCKMGYEEKHTVTGFTDCDIIVCQLDKDACRRATLHSHCDFNTCKCDNGYELTEKQRCRLADSEREKFVSESEYYNHANIFVSTGFTILVITAVVSVIIYCWYRNRNRQQAAAPQYYQVKQGPDGSAAPYPPGYTVVASYPQAQGNSQAPNNPQTTGYPQAPPNYQR